MKTKLQTQKNIVLFSPLKSCRNALNGLKSVFKKGSSESDPVLNADCFVLFMTTGYDPKTLLEIV